MDDRSSVVLCTILKISAMSREMMSCSCTYEFYSILNQVDSVLLKSVCTNQTLSDDLNKYPSNF